MVVICFGIIAVPKAAYAGTNDIFWGVDNNNKLWISHNELPAAKKTKLSGKGVWPHGNTSDKDKSAIMEAVVEAEFMDKVIAPEGSNRFFSYFYSLKKIKGIEKFDISKVTRMCWMFTQCNALTELDLSSFNTSRVTDMQSAFFMCKSLKTLKLGKMNTSKVTDMSSMFSYCQSLKTLDLSSFNTSKVTDMGDMFQNCESLTSLNIKSFNTSNVKYMYSMFNGCKSLTSLDLQHFNTSNVTHMGSMFSNCESLKTLNIKNFNTSKVTSAYSMFNYCKSLTALDVSRFNTSNMEKMEGMFSGCASLKKLDLRNFDVSKTEDGWWGVTNMLAFSTYRDGSKMRELTLSANLNKKLANTTLGPSGGNTKRWAVKYPTEVKGSYDKKGYDRSRASEMAALKLTGKKITYVAVDNAAPVITASDKTVAWGTTLETAIKGFKATDKEDGKLPLTVYSTGGYYCKSPRTYTVTLKATDSEGLTTKKKVKITIKDRKPGVAPTGQPIIRNTIANSAKKTNDVIWDKSKVKGATHYVINWRERGKSSWKSKTVGNTVRGTTDNLTIGALYEIRVRPKNAETSTTKAAYGTWSPIVYRYFHTTQKIRLKSASKGTFTMSWQKNPAATSYQVMYTTNSNGAGAANNIRTVGANSTSYTQKGLKSGVTYYVQVREIRKVNGISYIGNISCPVAVKVR